MSKHASRVFNLFTKRSYTITTPIYNKLSDISKHKSSRSSIIFMLLSSSSYSYTICRKISSSFISSVTPNTSSHLLKCFLCNFMKHEHLSIVLSFILWFHYFFKVFIMTVIICPPSQLERYALSWIFYLGFLFNLGRSTTSFYNIGEPFTTSFLLMAPRSSWSLSSI